MEGKILDSQSSLPGGKQIGNDKYVRFLMISDDAEARRTEIYRAMSGEQKLRVAYDLYLFARKVVESSIREYFPDIGPEELRKKMIERFYG